MLAQRPHEAGQLPGHGDDGLLGLDASAQVPVALVEANLGSPGQLDNLGWNCRLALPEGHRDSGRVAGVVRSITQHMTQQRVAGLGDPAPVVGWPARGFGRYQPGIGHELGRGGEAAEVADLGNDGGPAQEANSAEGLKSGDGLAPGAGAGTGLQRALQPSDPLPGGLDHRSVVIEHDLVCLMLEVQAVEPGLVAD